MIDWRDARAVAERLRRAMPRNGDVLELTGWVLEHRCGGGGEGVLADDPVFVARLRGELEAMGAEAIAQLQGENLRLAEENEELRRGGGGGCAVCAARREAERLRVKRHRERRKGGG